LSNFFVRSLNEAAGLADYNRLRVQGWTGNIALSMERHLFGQQPGISGAATQDAEAAIHRISETLLPLQERCHRMMARSLSAMR